ncbi:MAG: VOC family protein [Bacteroidetes bacterium]|nr:VOC family protein [Bacteroidota bacterium]
MAHTAIYLNFDGKAEEAFNHYRKIFGTEFAGPMVRYKDNPSQGVELSEADLGKIAHVALPITGGVQIMGNDVLQSLGQKLVAGNNFTLVLSPDAKDEADRLYQGLAEGGPESVAPHEEFWGYWGTCTDRFGIRWMFNIVKQWS